MSNHLYWKPILISGSGVVHRSRADNLDRTALGAEHVVEAISALDPVVVRVVFHAAPSMRGSTG